MKGPALTIYFIAAEANSAAMRKLKGTALALGVLVKIVESVRQLPLVPEPNSILVLPESVKLGKSDDHDSSWLKIYILSSHSNFTFSEVSKISMPSASSGLQPDMKLLHAILFGNGINPQALWYASSGHFDCLFDHAKSKFEHWFRSHKVNNYPAISAFTQSLDTLALKFAGRKLKASISTDGFTAEIALSANTHSKEEQKVLIDLISYPFANWMIASVDENFSSIRFQCDLNSTHNKLIRIIQIKSLAHGESTDTSDREAS